MPRIVAALLALLASAPALAADPPHAVLQWVKRHPQADSKNPRPNLGYEGSYGYDPLTKLLIHYGGHNQGGGGEQNSEVWTYDLAADLWKHHEPNDCPPGVCCAQQNVFHPRLRKFVRFPAFSGGHGWQSPREIALKDSSVWTYDPDANRWQAMRPAPDIRPSPLRGAAYHPGSDLIVLHGGEGSNHGTVAYDLATNTWHKLNSKGGPEASLSQPGFAYDAVNDVFVSFGSQFGSDPKTYLFDLGKNAWRVLETKDHPPADKTSPVLAADTRNGVVLCLVRSSKEENAPLETWVLDVKAATWTKLADVKPPDPSGSRNRMLLYLEDQNLFVLENNTDVVGAGGKKSREQQMWTFRYREVKGPGPYVPTHVKVSTATGKPVIDYSGPLGRCGFSIERAGSDDPTRADYKDIAGGYDSMEVTDDRAERGTVYRYRVWLTDDEVDSPKLHPVLVRNQPGAPAGMTVSAADARRVQLTWPRAPERDVVGYVVERAPVAVYSNQQSARVARRYADASDAAPGAIKAVGAFKALTDKPVADPAFTDTTTDLSAGQQDVPEPHLGGRVLRGEQFNQAGKPYRFTTYAYRVRAVNKMGVASGPSPMVFTYPAAVENLRAKEEGKTATRLKWDASPAAGIKGYLVYRHDGRYDKDPITRLTPEPIAATEFLDEQSGAGSRRYEVVAVDALGQQGEPTTPVWSRREYKRYYDPFVGEWHQ
ncbi:MAG TPA: fibronectin type III domain-containing protein [Humisphaera sp.]